MADAIAIQEAMEPVKRLSIDLAKSAKTLSINEARFLVDAYYMMQENRIRSDAQMRTLRENDEPHAVIEWLGAQDSILETQIKRALDKWTDEQFMGRWCKAIVGIGPVIAAGLLAHIDMQPWTCGVHKVNEDAKPCTRKEPHEGSPVCGPMRLTTVGHIWRYAGLDPSIKWQKGQKRPFNAGLKTLCYKIGESFVKVQNNDNDFYGHWFVKRKALYLERNEKGAYIDRSELILTEKKIGKSTDAYKAYSTGKFPPAHIHAMARRATVKLFLSHLHATWYQHLFNEPAPKPFAIAVLGHAHDTYIAPPNH